MGAAADFSARWQDLGEALGLSEIVSVSVQHILLESYQEVGRHYHTASHIVAMLGAMQGLTFARPNTVRLAIFFHDAVYDPARSDNEALSAHLMRDCLSGHVTTDVLDRAATMIEATKHHTATGDDDTDLLLDLDMGIIGQAWPVYETYAQGIFAEYTPVFGREAYCLGRVSLFIEPNLEKDALFLTPAFEGLDARARDNLQREKAWLQDGAP